MLAFDKIIKEEPYTMNWGAMVRKGLKVDVIPPMTGVILFGTPYITINSHKYLQDFYVNNNQYITKHPCVDAEVCAAGGKSLFMTPNEAPKLTELRKALSGAFFKQRLVGMSTVIKSVTFEVIQKYQTLIC